MLVFSGVVTLILLMLLTRPALAGNDCRQCFGIQKMKFVGFVDQAEAKSFAIESLKNCATGGAYVIRSASAIRSSGCSSDGLSCKEWWLNLSIWRYCGNGRKVLLYKGYYCVDTTCIEADDLDATCTRSVACSDTCNPKQCG